jgi:mycofactocin system FadH/OYE family oxidoreductase 1
VLTTPGLLAGRTVPSRVVFGPHATDLADPRHPGGFSGDHVTYYARRASGGAGLIVTEVASVHDSDRPYERAPCAADAAPGWAAVGRACREHGTLVLAGLGHAGAQGSSAHHRRPLWGPSAFADPVTREVPVAMDDEAIAALVAGFAAAAAGARAAGLDGVEIQAGQYALLRQFLSPLTNHRTDRWGAERDLLLRETLAAVRTAVGDDGVVGLRLAVDELAPWAGLTPDTVRVPAGADYVVGVRGSGLAVGATRPDAHTPPGHGRPLAAALRRTAPADTAVVLAGGVVESADAEAALADGTADLVEMTRALVADPDLVATVRAGRAPRPCVLANERCRVRDIRNTVVSCSVAPVEEAFAVPPVPPAPPLPSAPAGRGHDVRVVGGGPAGLEGARVLAAAGYRVVLHERDDELGGALRAVARLPGRGRYAALVAWWRTELARLGVAVRVGDAVRPGDAVLRADTALPTLWATGGLDRDPPLPEAPTCGAAAVLAGTDPPAGPVVVLDPLGDATGVGLAELLAGRGREVALVTPDPVVGHELGPGGDLVPAAARLVAAGVRRVVRTVPVRWADGVLHLRDAATGAPSTLPCGAVVDAARGLPGPVPVDAEPVEGLLVVGRTVLAGDVLAPRTVHDAVLDGRRAAARVAVLAAAGPPP